MNVTVWYWVKSYDKELGFKQGDVIDVTLEQITELSDKYDVAIMSSRIYDEDSKKDKEIKLLAIDEKYRHFRSR